MKQKSIFLKINNRLYLKKDSIFENHKQVIHQEDVQELESVAKEIHCKTNIVYNKLESICRKIFLRYKRYYKKVVREYEQCRFFTTLKNI